MPRNNHRTRTLQTLELCLQVLFINHIQLSQLAMLQDSTDLIFPFDDENSISLMLHVSFLNLRFLLSILTAVRCTRYMFRSRHPGRSNSFIKGLLRNSEPGRFRRYVRMDYPVFLKLVDCLKDNKRFHVRGPGRHQRPVIEQVLMVMMRFGHSGNMARYDHIASLAGMSLGSVMVMTKRVILAIVESNLRSNHVRWPTGEEKEAAKDWVAERSGTEEWKGGYCMIDGTLVPIYQKPRYFGDRWYDRKSNYSMNVQIINTGNLKIIDYSTGHVGSSHDATCLASTRLAEERDRLLAEGEWCWGDAGFPLQTWLIIPFKRPETNHAINRRFNYNLSRIRIASEHAIGYLKGRFQSLKGLRVNVNAKPNVRFLVNWVNACIVVHAFCQDHELDIIKSFLRSGMRTRQEQEEDCTMQEGRHVGSEDRQTTLLAGKKARERLRAFI